MAAWWAVPMGLGVYGDDCCHLRIQRCWCREHEKAGDKTADHEGCLVGGSELMGMGNKYFWLFLGQVLTITSDFNMHDLIDGQISMNFASYEKLLI